MDRQEAQTREMRRATAEHDPFKQFAVWFREANDQIPVLPEGMTLATCGDDGQPQARVVLLKEFDHRGFVFFTNYNSAKGRELEQNKRAALNFWWGALERQVRITGQVEKVTDQESDFYFLTRPLGSRLGAWASEQSARVDSRDTLEARFAELEQRYPDGEVPRPSHWGGYRLKPDAVEFWQGRPDRLHDRLLYERRGDEWQISRLNP
ncbi:MAG: pyridoxamine 5'-phosphate oxidase [Acidobacteria bacterium]|nr:pyridoxamine 5'-phosphate oxidase [Acidobacteriota bacterium]